jgi:hypothetical protein
MSRATAEALEHGTPRDPQSGASARLHLEGVDTTVVARKRDEGPDGAVVEQPLPFLQLGSRFQDAEGRTGRIEGVRTEIDGEMPRLVIQLAYEIAESGVRSREATVPFEVGPRAQSAEQGREQTQSFETTPRSSHIREIVVGGREQGDGQQGSADAAAPRGSDKLTLRPPRMPRVPIGQVGGTVRATALALARATGQLLGEMGAPFRRAYRRFLDELRAG